MLTLNEYQRQALRTAQVERRNDMTDQRGLACDALGIAGEAGEVADLVKKQVGHGHPADHEKMKRELGDVLWYVSVLAHRYGFTLEEVATANVAKLRARYPDGFSSERSINRLESTTQAVSTSPACAGDTQQSTPKEKP